MKMMKKLEKELKRLLGEDFWESFLYFYFLLERDILGVGVC